MHVRRIAGTTRPWAAQVALSCLFLALPQGSGAAGADEEFEAAPVLKASEILPPEVVKGERYAVQEEVVNDGYMNFFRVTSDFGEFEAYGQAMLDRRIREIGALDQLDELSKTKVFAEALSRSALSQVKTVKEFAEKPVATVKGLPGGLKRTFKRYKRDVQEGYETAKEVTGDIGDAMTPGGEGDEGSDGQSTSQEVKELADQGADAATDYGKKYFGLTRAERHWWKKTGTDPYTSNEVLRAEIKEVARVAAAGGFAVKLAGVPRIPGVDYIGDLNEMVWDRDPRELKEENTKRLAAMGADEALSEKLLDNPALSPSHQTYLVAALHSLEDAEDRALAVELFAEAETEEEAMFFVGNALLLAGFHRAQSPIARLLPSKPVPVALTADNRLVSFAAVDHLVWTEGIAAAAARLTEAYDDLVVERRELWLRGRVTERCRRELESLGWTVRDRIEFGSALEQMGKAERGTTG